MTPPYVVIQKQLGETPLEAIDRWRIKNPKFATLPATYAGRLDPMATGALLVLLGDECKRQDKYRGLDKEYEIEVLLDLSTDTGDVLGLATHEDADTSPTKAERLVLLKRQIGVHTVPYPAFSSKTVNGKPLFQYALEGALDSIPIPTHTETIYRIKELEFETLLSKSLCERIMQMLSQAPRTNMPSKRLGEDFRRDAIRTAWKQLFSDMPERTFSVLRLRVTCASGSYMRSLAERIGKELGTHAIALSIRRTRIGIFRSIFTFGFWIKLFR